jgi:SAM-dependent methyltransferase
MNTTDGSESERFWETHYARSNPPSGTPDPNDAFVTIIDEFAPQHGQRHALELGSGRGGDALWLAERGWAVTATDASATATRRLNDLAQRTLTAGSMNAVQADLASVIPNGEFDLVFGCYFQSPVSIDRNAIIGRAAQKIRRGGLLIVIDHASSAPWSWNQDAIYPSAEQTRAEMGLNQGWQSLTVTARTRTALSPADGVTQAAVTDNIVVLRREP